VKSICGFESKMKVMDDMIQMMIPVSERVCAFG